MREGEKPLSAPCARYHECMRVRLPLLALAAVVFFMPVAASAGIPFFGPIIPAAYSTCAASWGMLIWVINNIISFLLTLAIMFVLPLMIAWAGFLYVINPLSPSKREAANSMLWHAIVGIVLSLAAWLIVNAVMVALYNPTSDSKLGAWYSIVSGNMGDVCQRQAGVLNPVRGTGVSATDTLNPPVDKTGAACDPAKLQEAARKGGIVLTPTEANVFACIAKPESTCGTVLKNYSWNKGNAQGKASTAAGAFQVLLSSNAKYYENPACRAAAGVSGSLNCRAGFGQNGFTAGGDPKVLEYCLKAAADLSCSTTAAALLMRERGSFSPWQADKSNSVQTQCINNGGKL